MHASMASGVACGLNRPRAVLITLGHAGAYKGKNTVADYIA